MVRYYPESDGGDTWVGHYWSRQPKTYYVVDSVTLDRVGDDCKTWREAKLRAEILNAQEAKST